MRLRIRLFVLAILVPACTSTARLDFGQGSPTPTPSGTTPVPTPTAAFSPVASPVSSPNSQGPVTITTFSTGTNVCYPLLLTDTAAGSVKIEGAATFSANDRVLLWQVTDAYSTGADDAASIAFGASLAGRYQVDAVTASAISPDSTTTTVNLEILPALAYASDAGRAAQLCTFPVFGTLTLSNVASRIVGSAWNGRINGIVAFQASTLAFTSTGEIEVDGLGFRGGVPGVTPSTLETSALDCAGSNAGGPKGEGTDSRQVFGIAKCRSQYAIAGGGGNGRNAGGGGGGGGAAGGRGGDQETGGTVGLRTAGGGGVGILPPARQLLTLGGGGGAGDHTGSLLVGNVNGGKGGGAILIFVDSVTGTGAIHANGYDGSPGANSGGDSAGGGGGGGGTIRIEAPSLPTGVSVDADGASGGAGDGSAMLRGPGGGGGGGRVEVPAGSAVVTANGGLNGVTGASMNDPHGAAPGSNATVVQH